MLELMVSRHCSCLQVQGDDSALTIKDLFTEINYNNFPDKVNEPTLFRLNQFLKGAKLPLAEGVTVRELVRSMMKISVPDVCQCWRMFDSLCMADTGHLSEEQRRTKRVLELQRVVVNCSQGVFGIMEEAYKERAAMGNGGKAGTLRKRSKQARKVRLLHMYYPFSLSSTISQEGLLAGPVRGRSAFDVQSLALVDCTTVSDVRSLLKETLRVECSLCSCQVCAWLRHRGMAAKVVDACALNEVVGVDLLEGTSWRELAEDLVTCCPCT